MAGSKIDPDRLYSALLNTGLQNKDQPLYQVIYLLIGQVVALTNITSAGGGSGGGSSTTIINNLIQQLALDGSDGGGGSDISIPGPRGEDGANGMVPYFIAVDEIFTVPEFKQALFAMNIDVEGILVIDGFLIEVDGGGGGGDTINNQTVILWEENYYDE
jgi:hypothetical protein